MYNIEFYQLLLGAFVGIVFGFIVRRFSKIKRR